MQKFRHYPLTIDLLRRYSTAALQNATDLLAEAELLESQGHHARAYFIAVASMEEAGKAHLAFDGQGRNIASSAVASKMRKSFDDHSSKITAAFIPWLLACTDVASSAKVASRLMVDLKLGREPSMYTDVVEDGVTVQSPSVVVRPAAAHDCVRLARDCLTHTRRHFKTKQPTKTSPAHDEFFAMKLSLTQKIMNTEDFWAYHIARLKSGHTALEESVTLYDKKFFQKQATFQPSPAAK